jgi:phenylalanyl-tRNA synthetase alpha chain
MTHDDALNSLIERLSPLELKVIPLLGKKFGEIKEKSGLDDVSLIRALRLLEAKGLLTIKTEKQEIIELGVNGIYYKKNQLPERSLLLVLEKSNYLLIDEAKKLSKLSENEFKVSLGVLKSKAFISLENGKVVLQAKKEELIKKTLEEQFIGALPLPLNSLAPEQKHAFENLKKRKDIIEIETKQSYAIELTETGKKIAGKEIKSNLIEEITPEVIKKWGKQDKFRKYDLLVQVPKIHGGKRHFVNEAIDKARSIWLELGFTELEGPLVDSSFWVFDALFTPQDHPVREMHDTFFVKDVRTNLPNKEIVSKVKQAHESGISDSIGWNYKWSEEEARKAVLRTHTTALSVRTLANKPKLPAKYFAIGKVFRNEAVDWKHGFEFYQAEGIVVDKNANFCQLLGYLNNFYKKMGFEKIRFRPSFFAYTEPSVEIEVFHPVKKEWIELGGAGIFRPEVVVPLLGEFVPVLAWGQGFDRIIMNYYKISDLREMYENDIKKLREKRSWI